MAHSAGSAFHVGDHVSWNSEAGRVTGVIKSDKTEHVAVHKGSALRKLRAATVRGAK